MRLLIQIIFPTGTETKFGGYLSSPPTFLKYQMDIYGWRTKVAAELCSCTSKKVEPGVDPINTFEMF